MLYKRIRVYIHLQTQRNTCHCSKGEEHSLLRCLHPCKWSARNHCDLRNPHMKESNGVRSCDLGGLFISPLWMTKIPSNRSCRMSFLYELCGTLRRPLDTTWNWLSSIGSALRWWWWQYHHCFRRITDRWWPSDALPLGGTRVDWRYPKSGSFACFVPVHPKMVIVVFWYRSSREHPFW